MPKIIENLQERLIAEARKQIAQSGYSSMTIRSVAAGCGVGVGTVYNYFKSKDELLAAYMLEDWKACIRVIQTTGEGPVFPETVVRCIYDQLLLFAEKNRSVFQDPAAAAGFTGSFNRYHGLLRSQLAQPLEKFCDSRFSAEFIAEAVLTWTMAGKTFDEIYTMVGRLFCVK